MTSQISFSGFPKQTVTFFRNLAKNNNKMWFDQNKDVYEQQVLVPARDFILALGTKLKKIAPGVHADPRVNKSIFRLNRDIRFSHDKTPYTTHLGIWFWEGSRPRMECSGFYFHLEPERCMLGVGLYAFPKDMLETYRRSVVHPKHGPALAKAITAIKKNKDYYVGDQHYKKIPQGFDPTHKNAEYLLYDGLYAGVELPVSAKLFSEGFVDLCFEHYKKMASLHRWLLALTERV
ncbi:MAG: DUF2461 domain-containing protein [Deltaproteobacteria bacterium]|nr:DUF2461 domain-containing protein [Deltaproteobacteria bacterium]